MAPDWVDLPPEIITLICVKASTTNIQYVHLRAVCKAWRRALTPRPHHLPRQFPWLLLPCRPRGIYRGFSVGTFPMYFYELSQSKTHQFMLPYGCNICGSYYGWLVLEHGKGLSLHNPITRSFIDLPSWNSPPITQSKRKRSIPGVQHFVRRVEKAMLSCNPSKPGCVVVAWCLYTSNWELGFCRIGDAHWTVLKMQEGPYLMNFVCYNNLVYTIDNKGIFLVYDLQDLAVRTFASKFSANGQINLVEGDAQSGGPLVVRNTVWPSAGINVYKWFDDLQRWCQVRNIGKRSLFLNERHCTNLQLGEEFQNELFVDVKHNLPGIAGSWRIAINQVNLKSESVIPHSSGTMQIFSSWYESPLWFTPSLI